MESSISGNKILFIGGGGAIVMYFYIPPENSSLTGIIFRVNNYIYTKYQKRTNINGKKKKNVIYFFLIHKNEFLRFRYQRSSAVG